MIKIADVKWIKISTDIFNNRKIKQIRKLPEGDSIIGVWVQILCLAGQINDNGMVYFSKDVPYTEEMLSVEFDRSINIIRIALKTFENFRMLDIVDNILLVSNWEKYQSVDKLEKIKEQNRIRKQKQREKDKLLLDCHVTSHAIVTQCHATELDIELDKDIDINNIVKQVDTTTKKKFAPPTIEEVKTYCLERKNNVDYQKWYDFYLSKGWYVGKNKMKDWKACVRTWEKDSTPKTTTNTKSNKFHNFEQEIGKMAESDLQAIADKKNKEKLKKLGIGG